MIFQLDYFRQIIYQAHNGYGPEHDQGTVIVEINEEVQRITKKIDTYQPDDISGLTDYIHFQLDSLTRTALEIEDILVADKKIDKALKIQFEAVLKGIDSIITHIRTYFTRQFDHNTLLTQKARTQFLKINDEKITDLNSILAKYRIDTVLNEILKDALYLRLHQNPRYRHLKFSEQLLNFLPQVASGPLPLKNILKTLISWKFNHPRFFDYYTGLITNKLGESPNISDHFRELIFQRKQILQMPIENVIAYSSHLPMISDSLLQVIDSELEFMKQLDFLNSELMNSGILDSTYKVSLSVKQLAYLIYLAVEVGIITERKAKRVHEYVVTHISTSETEKISEKSFSNGYYVPSPGDISKVSDKLAAMLALAQGQY